MSVRWGSMTDLNANQDTLFIVGVSTNSFCFQRHRSHNLIEQWSF